MVRQLSRAIADAELDDDSTARRSRQEHEHQAFAGRDRATDEDARIGCAAGLLEGREVLDERIVWREVQLD